tara:strand:- start:130 stop:975 length:846 start_codon:yes stop_codon:yes gene_type:complete
MNVLELINQGSHKLKYNKIISHKLDSEILLSKVLQKKREEILINLDKSIKLNEFLEFRKLINRRSLKEPIAYIIREKEFWSKKFEVEKGILIPRPETELIVEKLVKMFKNKQITFLDIGTGSGCILISLISELKTSFGIGIDISKKALKVAKKNALNHHVYEKIKLLNKSFTDLRNQKFDLIVSNPPYLESRTLNNLDDDIRKYEPLTALDGGNDGLDVIKKVIYKAKEILKINGTLALEIGNEQFNKVSILLKKNRFKIKFKINDYKDNCRCVISTFLGN